MSDGLLIRQGDTAVTGGEGVRRLTDTAGGDTAVTGGGGVRRLTDTAGGGNWDRRGRCQTAY